MANLRYNLVRFEDEATLTVFHDGQPHVVTDSHPSWAAIVEGVVVNDDPAALDLIDVAQTVSREFRRLGEQVTVVNGRLYFDNDEVNNAISNKIIEFLEAGVDDWKPLVNFMQKVMANPEKHSQEQMFEWLLRHQFSINEDGDILGYKSVKGSSREGFDYESITSGRNVVVVDGEEFTGRVPQSVGSVVEMARSEVQHDPAQGCGPGLHVANFRYASTWNGDSTVLLVAVNPRDVVSVPTESNWEKVRTCRYRVVKVVEGETNTPLVREVAPAVAVEVEEDDSFSFGTWDDDGGSWNDSSW